MNPRGPNARRPGGDHRGLQRAIGALDPSLAAGYVASLEHLLSSSLSPQSITTGTLSVFAGIALLLAVIGIYGMMSYTVTQRTREIGIRMALGAQQDDVVRRVLRHGLKLDVIGMAIGSVAPLGLTRGMATLLREISPRDPLTFGAVTAILTRPRCGAARYMAERPA